jgi:hypothetical protein
MIRRSTSLVIRFNTLELVNKKMFRVTQITQ